MILQSSSCPAQDRPSRFCRDWAIYFLLEGDLDDGLRMPNLAYQEWFAEDRAVAVEEGLSSSRRFPCKGDAPSTRAELYMLWNRDRRSSNAR